MGKRDRRLQLEAELAAIEMRQTLIRVSAFASFRSPRHTPPMFRKTLFVNPPSWQGFDGGAGSRYQAKREVRSFWFPTWLAQPAALIEGSRLVDAPPHDQTQDDVLRIAKDYELVVIHTSAPTLRGDAKLAEAIKSQKPDTQVGFVGAQAAVMPDETIGASEAID